MKKTILFCCLFVSVSFLVSGCKEKNNTAFIGIWEGKTKVESRAGLHELKILLDIEPVGVDKKDVMVKSTVEEKFTYDEGSLSGLGAMAAERKDGTTETTVDKNSYFAVSETELSIDADGHAVHFEYDPDTDTLEKVRTGTKFYRLETGSIEK